MISKQMVAWGESGSSIREIAAYGERRAAEIGPENVYNFAIGNPSIDPPDCVQEAVERLLHTVPPTQLHAYAPAPGMASVREKVAAYLTDTFGEAYRAQDIYMTDGASSALAILTRALMGPGDEAIVFAPYFPEYRVWIETAGATCVEAMADPKTFQVDTAAVDAAITPNTKAVIIDSPNNPTGAVYTRDTLARLANVLREANAQRDPENPIMLISDEPYREIVYGAEVPWVPSIYENTVVCYSYSKSLSLPGERVGWILVPNTNPQAARLMPAVAGAARTLGFVCAPALFQRVIIDCIDEPSDVEAYARNRTALTDALADYGYTYVEPDGAFYLWVKALEPDANAFCERAKKYEVLAVPSDSFGMPGWFRLGYCVSYETIVNSLPAWKQLADEYRRK